MRQLKHHEKKLLKKVNFFSYKKENNVREIKILRRYHIQDREDYVKYNKIVGHVTELVRRLKALDSKDPFRMNLTDQLLDKLYMAGVVPTKKGLAVCDKLAASSLCRRRLPVVMVRLHMSETLREAVTLIEQGHVRVGPDVVTDRSRLPAEVGGGGQGNASAGSRPACERGDGGGLQVQQVVVVELVVVAHDLRRRSRRSAEQHTGRSA